MANVDNLNFSVIINDDDFDARCAAIEKRAQELNTNLSNILQIEGTIPDVQQYKDDIKTMTSQIDGLRKNLESAAKNFERVAKERDKLLADAAKGQLSTKQESSNATKETLTRDEEHYQKLAEYHLSEAQAKEKENSYRKIGNQLVKESLETSKELRAQFAYLAEEEEKAAKESKKMSDYYLSMAQSMEKQNSFKKVGNDLVKESAEVSKQIKEQFAYLVEEEKKASEESRKMADYYLTAAQAMEKQNAFKSIGGDVVKEAAETSKQLKEQFSYLAEEEKKAEEESRRLEQEKLKATEELVIQTKKYLDYINKAAEIERGLKVRQVRDSNSVLTTKEIDLLNRYKQQYSALRVEIDKITAKYPHLKSVFEQAFNLNNAKLAVAEEKEIARETEKVTREKERQNKAAKAAVQGTKQLTDEAKKLTMETGKVTKYWNQFKNILGGATSIYAIKSILSNMIEITGEFELQKTTLRAILQDANKADVIFEKIKGLALVSPFNFKELISYSKQLSAFSIPAEELYDTAKMLADLSAGLGVGMDRLILAFGQVRSAAVLRGQEVRQFTEAGIPLIEALRQEFERLGEEGITTGQVFDKISARLVPFEMVKKVLTDMTEEGGKFYNMQEVQSETLKGRLSNLKDAFQMMFNEIGESQSDVLKGAVDTAKEMMKNWEQIGKDILVVAAAYGTYKVAIGAIWPVLKIFISAQKAFNMAQRAGVVTLTASEMATNLLNKKMNAFIANSKLIKAIGNPYAILAAGAAALGFALYKTLTYQNEYQKGLSEIEKAGKAYDEQVDKDVAQMGSMLAELRHLTEGTEEYAKVKNNIMNTYGQYLSDQQLEAINTKGLANSYDILAAAISNANKEKYKIQLITEFEGERTDWKKDFMQDIKDALENEGFSKELGKYVYGIITGAINLEDIADSLVRTEVSTFMHRYRYIQYQTGGVYSSSSTIKDTKNYFDTLLGIYNAKMKEFDDLVSEAEKDFDFIDPNNLKQVEKNLQDYQKTVQKYYKDKIFPGIEELSKEQSEKLSAQPFWASDVKNNEGGIAYAKTLKETYERINNELDRSELLNAQTIKDYEEQLKQIREIDALFNGAILRDLTEKNKKEKENPYKDQIDALKRQYDLIKSMQSAYETLNKAGFGDLQISKFFKDTLGYKFTGTNFDDQIKEIITSLRTMGDEGVKAAENIANSANKVDLGEAVRKLTDIQDRFKKLRSSLDKWEMEDFSIFGEGALFDMSKSLRDYQTRVNELKSKAIEAEKELDAVKGKYSEDEYNAEKDRIDRLYQANVEYEQKLTAEKIKNLGKQYGQDAVGNNSAIKTRDYGDLSLGQIRTSIAELNKLLSVSKAEFAALLPEEDLRRLNEAGVSLEDFYNEYMKYIQAKKSDNETEAFKKVVKSARKAAGYISTLSASLENLGNTSGNSGLVEAANLLDKMAEASEIVFDTLDDISGAMEEAAEKTSEFASSLMSSSDWITMIVKAVVYVAKIVIDSFAQQAEAEANTRKALSELRKEYEQLTHDDNLSNGMNTIFGENAWKNIRNLTSEISRLKKAQESYMESAKGFISVLKADEYLFGSKSILGALKEIDSSFQLINEDGTFNLKSWKELQTYIENNGNISTEYAEEYEEIIQLAEEYEDALEQLDDAISDIFGDMASNIADSMIEAFSATGNALSNLEDSFKSAGNSFVKTMLQSMLIEEVFSKYEDKVKDIITSGTSYEEKINAMAEVFDSAEEDMYGMEDGINALLETAREKGWLDTSDSSLSSSIQGITEETANRLANLINGIYAEVFRQGAIFDTMNLNVAAILSTMGSVSENKYQDYLMQIQANTYDTAENTRNLVERMEAVMASTGGTGGSGIKVYLQN